MTLSVPLNLIPFICTVLSNAPAVVVKPSTFALIVSGRRKVYPLGTSEPLTLITGPIFDPS